MVNFTSYVNNIFTFLIILWYHTHTCGLYIQVSTQSHLSWLMRFFFFFLASRPIKEGIHLLLFHPNFSHSRQKKKKNPPHLKAASSYLGFYVDGLWIMFFFKVTQYSRQRSKRHAILSSWGVDGLISCSAFLHTVQCQLYRAGAAVLSAGPRLLCWGYVD